MKPSAGGMQGLIEKAAPTLAATAAISQAVGIPTMAASGIRSASSSALLHVYTCYFSTPMCTTKEGPVVACSRAVSCV
jgi:hypothetical protein